MAKRLTVPLEQGIFYPFYDGYFLPFRNLDVTESVALEEQLFSNSALTVWSAYCERVKDIVGYFFKSPFTVRCEGGYLLCYIQPPSPSFIASNVEGAVEEEGEELLPKRKKDRCVKVFKDDNLVLFNYPNRGALALSPKLAPWVERVLDEQ